MTRFELLAIMAAIISTHDSEDENALCRARDLLDLIETAEQERVDAEAAQPGRDR